MLTTHTVTATMKTINQSTTPPLDSLVCPLPSPLPRLFFPFARQVTTLSFAHFSDKNNKARRLHPRHTHTHTHTHTSPLSVNPRTNHLHYQASNYTCKTNENKLIYKQMNEVARFSSSQATSLAGSGRFVHYRHMAKSVTDSSGQWRIGW